MGAESMSVPWAIDSEAMRARGIIVLVKSNYSSRSKISKIKKF